MSYSAAEYNFLDSSEDKTILLPMTVYSFASFTIGIERLSGPSYTADAQRKIPVIPLSSSSATNTFCI